MKVDYKPDEEKIKEIAQELSQNIPENIKNQLRLSSLLRKHPKYEVTVIKNNDKREIKVTKKKNKENEKRETAGVFLDACVVMLLNTRRIIPEISMEDLLDFIYLEALRSEESEFFMESY